MQEKDILTRVLTEPATKRHRKRIDRYKNLVSRLKVDHFFVLVEEAHGYVLGTTKSVSKAIDWYLDAVKQQWRWFNPAVYVCNYRPVDKGEESVPKSAIPVLSSYSYLKEGISEIREEYLKKFPLREVREAGKESW